MNEDEETPLTMSREALYELAWSKPMRELAKDFLLVSQTATAVISP
jgi:hypothetical protein